MPKITVDPVFRWSSKANRYVLVAHRGQYEAARIPSRFDRGAVQQAKGIGKSASEFGTKEASSADIERSTVLPGLQRDVEHPTGFTPEQLNDMMVRQQQAAGGANAALTGEGTLAAMRTRTAGGFAPALAEAARAKGRTLAEGALGVSERNAELEQQKQQAARDAMMKMYGIDTGARLSAYDVQNQALAQQLAAGRQGWLQNTLDTIKTLSGAGTAAADIKKAWS